MRRPVHTHSGAPAELESLAAASSIFFDGLGDCLLRGLLGRLLVVLGFALGLLVALRLFGRLLVAGGVLGESGKRRQQENAARDQSGGRRKGAAQHGGGPNAGMGHFTR